MRKAMKHSLVPKMILLLVFCFAWAVFKGQSSFNLLSYNDSINYVEGRIKIRNTLNIEIFLEKPEENYTCIYSLELAFVDPRNICKHKVLTLPKDTTVMKSEYIVYELSRSLPVKPGSPKISGRIEIVEWTKRKATIKLDLSIDDITRNEQWKYIGTRSFKKRSNLK